MALFRANPFARQRLVYCKSEFGKAEISNSERKAGALN